MNNKLTIIIPAYNEAGSIVATILSIKQQTKPPKKIIVVDDCSTDDTFKLAASTGITVMRPPRNTGTKAGAQNFALKTVDTEYTMAIDADTTLEKDAIEKLLPALVDNNVVAACGFVLPRYVNTIWERGRYIEYLFAFTFYKQIQDYYGKPLISSGCFSVYKTKVLKDLGGWSNRTMAEDMDLTWSFYERGYGVRFVPEAMCYPIEPHNFGFMRKQLKRWSHGLVQNVKLHWRGILKIQYLKMMVVISLWDGVVASIAYLILLPLLAIIFLNPLFLLGYIIDIPAIMVPIIYTSIKRRELMLAIFSLPAFFILRTINGVFLLEAVFSEIVLNKKLVVYEKGH